MKDSGLLNKSKEYNNKHDLSFHCDLYNFNSEPEHFLFEQISSLLNTDLNDIEAFLFIGRLIDSQKTDFHFKHFKKVNAIIAIFLIL